MNYECFEVSIENQVAHIVLSRPEKRNAMNLSFWNDIQAIVEDIDDNAKARAIVISSTGPIFCAGIDLSMLSAVNGHGDKNKGDYGPAFYDTVTRLQDNLSALEKCRVPVIVAIQGGCIGGGVDLVTAADIRLGTKDSYICIQEINVGMTADVGTFPRILNHMPEGIVKELAYTGRKMGSDELEKHGFYNSVHDTQEEAVQAALDMAAEIATKAPLAVYGCKRIITYARDHSTADTLDQIGVWNMSMLVPNEMMEAMQAKMQKRDGKYLDLPKRKKG
ncbi:MAG: enoyl-CoA hydratase [Hellea sp.]|nr:enoyl-CoA hydratase [Hellea sp.]